jgi:phosphatidylserine/phosphatidylglycerophosphate/cardiolipin synthase-like enzyme
MKFASTNDERARVQQKRLLPDLGPRKDYAVRVEGPAARDVDDVLRVRWDQGLAEGAMFADHATPFTVPEPSDATPGTVTLQVVATLPPPIAERSILETWEKALRRAQRLVYVEDQYFRMPILEDAIADALAANPGLRLVVITKPLTVSDGGKKWTVAADRRFRALAPDRYLLLQLKSFDAVGRVEPLVGDETAAWYFVDMDVHSKMLVVDDAYLSVGSCNKNNRGLLYEGELDVAVADPAWVKAARQRIVRNLVGPALAARVGDDPATDFDLLKEAATGNAAVEAWWVANGPFLAPDEVEDAADAHRPDGFAYPLELTPDYALDVGPDAF